MLWITLAVLATVLAGAHGSTNMDPKITITETVPPDDGKYVVRGFIANDVTLTCFVENIKVDTQVKWAKTMVDKDGRPTNQLISTDMDVQDNNKWSIEKPTTYSWRLRIKALQLEDEGNYTCYAQLNIDNRVEANRTVLATDPPTIIEALMSSDTMIKENEKVVLTCNASGRPTPTLMWRREGNAILPDGGVVKLGGALAITSAKFTDRGRYQCRAVNLVGEVTRDINVAIQFTPKLSSDAGDGEFPQALGYKRTLICYIDADPQPRKAVDQRDMYWTKNRGVIEYNERVHHRILEGAYSRLIFELIFEYVIESDYGEYVCTARNSMGSGATTLKLTKNDIPLPDKGGQISAAPSIHSCLATVLTFIIALLLSSRQ